MAYSYSNSAQAVGTANPQTLAYNPASGVVLLVLGIACRGAGARAGGAPTYNGLAMTQAGTTQTAGTGTTCSTEIWYISGPPTGSSLNFSVPNTGNKSLRLIASSYTTSLPGHYHQHIQVNGTTGTTANPSVSVTTTMAGTLVVDMMCNELNSAETARNRTLLFATDEGVWNTAAQYFLQTTAGAAAMTHTIGADTWALSVASFHEVNSVKMVIG